MRDGEGATGKRGVDGICALEGIFLADPEETVVRILHVSQLLGHLAYARAVRAVSLQGEFQAPICVPAGRVLASSEVRKATLAVWIR